MSRILRYVVPVDDQPHTLELPGPIVHVDSRQADVVEIWARDDGPAATRTFQVVGTGHEFPVGWQHLGTALVAKGYLVWHLMELP